MNLNRVQKAITNTRRFFREDSWFAGLFDSTRFKGDTSPQSTTFQSMETSVVDTSSIDTYDLVFNLQIPSISNTPFFSSARDKNNIDYYCNNKIHIRLYFKESNLFDNLVGTECIISPYIYEGQTDREHDGIYFASMNKIREDINKATQEAIDDGAPVKYDASGNVVKDVNGDPILRDASDRSGPFAESEKGVTDENIVEKLKIRTKLGKYKYLDKYIKYVADKIKPGVKDSPFQIYETRYSRDVPDSDNTNPENIKKFETIGLASNTNYMNIEKKERYFDEDYQHYMQFDFNLNEYIVEKDNNTGKITRVINKKHPNSTIASGSTALIDTNDSLILLLKKNQWISVVFKNINIPFDIKQIPEKMVKIEFQIDNISPPAKIGVGNIFYRNFFCEFLDMTLKLYNQRPIKVHDIMFQYEDMIRALQQKSDKYYSKIAQLNYIARKVIYYYLQNLDKTDNDKYTQLYREMKTSTKTAAERTTKLITGTSNVTTSDMSDLTKAVKDANNKIKNFSYIFTRDNIKIFRRYFLNAIMRIHQKTGLSKVTDKEILREYARIIEFMREAKTAVLPGEPSNFLATKVDKNGKPIKAVAIVPAGGDDGHSQAGGSEGENETTIVSYQTGGSKIFNSEDYNLMVPMDIHSPGNGINDMTVRIRKIHLQAGGEIIEPGETLEMDDASSVDIKVGDAIRFVYDNDIVYAIVCGFKPGKDLNDDGSDRRLEMNAFYKTYNDIRKTFESQELKKTPQQLLSLTNLRGIKYLPFKYNDENYSFTPYDSGESVSKSYNSKLKTGVNGKFVFSCKDTKIPILPNGYKLSFTSRFKEGVKNILSKLPLSTEVDIGKDTSLPQYSLPSYMSLEKVFVPPNFGEVIEELKNFRGDNSDDILSKLIEIMEKNGLNDSNDCKKTSEKIAASNTETRKKDFQNELKRINDEFRKLYVPKGQLVNREGAMQYIQRLYMQKVKEGVFVDNNGQPIRTATKLVFALNLIPNDPIKSMDLLIRALSKDGVLSISERNIMLNKQIISDEESKIKDSKSRELFEFYEGGGDTMVQYGGAEDTAKAIQIITSTINLLSNQNMIDSKSKEMLISNLQSAEVNYNPNEPEPTVASSTSMVKSGVGSNFGSGMGAMGAMGAIGAMGANIGSGFLSNLFNKGSMGSSSSSSSRMGSGSDSCGNNTSIMCSGDDLVITVTLKLNELIASCMEHESIQNYDSQPGNFQRITNIEDGGSYANASLQQQEPQPQQQQQQQPQQQPPQQQQQEPQQQQQVLNTTNTITESGTGSTTSLSDTSGTSGTTPAKSTVNAAPTVIESSAADINAAAAATEENASAKANAAAEAKKKHDAELMTAVRERRKRVDAAEAAQAAIKTSKGGKKPTNLSNQKINGKSNSSKSKKNNMSNKRKTKKVTFAKNKKIKFIK